MSSWQPLKLGDILNVKSGKDQKTVKCNDGKYQILGTGGEIGRTNSFLYDKSSVLIGRKGTIDKPIYEDEPFWTVDTLFYTEIKDGFLPKYIYYLFLTINWLRYNEASGIPSLTSSTIKKIKVKMPDLETQQKIVQILDSSNKIISTLQKRIFYERHRFSALKYELLFRRTNNKEGIKLKDLFNFKNGYTPSKSNPTFWENGTIPWFRMEDIRKNGRVLNDSIQHVTPKAIKGKPFSKGSIIISTTATIGEYAWLTADSLANQQFTYLIKKVNCSNRINIEYFYHYCSILSEWCKRNVNSGGLLTVDMKAFMNYRIKLPKLSEQSDISKFLSIEESLINLYEKKLRLLKQQYKYLLNHLINGDFDLSNIKLENGKEHK